MSISAELRCRCGEVRGSVTNPSPRTVNRVVCYCDDYQHADGRRVKPWSARGRPPHWVKVKNPKAPAVKREAEEDWGR
jgi:hypothetical protein